MNSLIKASVRAAVSGVPDYGPACPFCSHRPVQPEAPAPSAFRRCEECGSFLSDGLAQAHGTDTREPVFRAPDYWNRRVAWIRSLLPYAPRRVLDLECQDGALLNAWPFTARRDGIEPNGDLAGIAAASGLRVFTGEPTSFEPELPYDVITWYTGLEGPRNLRATLAKVGEWIAPGGFFVIGLPTPDCRRHRHGRRIASAGWISQSKTPIHPGRDWLAETIGAAGFDRLAEAWTSGGTYSRNPCLSEIPFRLPVVGEWLSHAGPLTQTPYFDYYEAAFRRS